MLDDDVPEVLVEEEFEQLDIHGVAARLGCSLRDVIDHVNAGRLNAYKFQDTVWFRGAEVDALV